MNGTPFGAGKVAAAAIAKWGSTANCFQQRIEDEAPDGSDISKWLPTSDGQGVRILLEPLSAIAAQKVFGEQTDVRFRGLVKTGTPIDLRMKNAVVIVRGHYKNMRFRVVEAPPWPIAGVIQLGLAETDEAIG